MASTETGALGSSDGGGAPGLTGSSHSRGDGNRGRARGRGGQRGRGRGDGFRGSGRGRGRGGGNTNANTHSQNVAAEPASEATRPPPQPGKAPAFKARKEGQDDDAATDAEVCFICASPIDHHSIAPCNHLTCHICALRMRALYKNKDCPHCRVSLPLVRVWEP